MSQQVIIIAGMHRSGTSLSASLLQKSGLFIGSDLMSGRFDNEKGHYEDLQVLELHEKDLALKGIDTTGMDSSIDFNYNFEPATEEKIQRFLNETKQVEAWGWKEPRTTLYLEAWKKKLQNYKCIAIYRHYDEVAHSLIKRYNHKLRNGIDMSLYTRLKHFLVYPINILVKKRIAYRSWSVYNTAILKFYEKFPEDTLIFELNNFIDNYNASVSEINKTFESHLKEIQVNDIVNKKLLSARKSKSLSIRMFSKKKLESILSDLNKVTQWM